MQYTILLKVRISIETGKQQTIFLSIFSPGEIRYYETIISQCLKILSKDFVVPIETFAKETKWH